MTLRGILIAGLAVVLGIGLGIAAARAKEAKLAEFDGPCQCIRCHGEYRWAAKTDRQAPPKAGITAVTPSEIGAWRGPGSVFHHNTHRVGKEKKWFSVTGRVSLVRLEPDGDLHIQLVDKGAKSSAVNLVTEVPNGKPWCAIRRKVFGWTHLSFPLRVRSGRKLPLWRRPTITVVGKAFYDAIHGGSDTTANRRKVPEHPSATSRQVAIWEVHPVMRLTVRQ